jgi:hypothetical protein
VDKLKAEGSPVKWSSPQWNSLKNSTGQEFNGAGKAQIVNIIYRLAKDYQLSVASHQRFISEAS